ncbi:MAG: hypothetical protein KGJ44_02490 [Betaproteobacteria bacterium]|nr:hypothetical protein [Betaproteobacteria bacterium]
MNNPLVLTDPSGYSWLSKTWKKLWRNEAFRIGLSFAAAWYGGQFIMGQLFEGALAAPGFSSAFAELATTGGTTSMQLTTLGSMTVGASGGFAGSLVGSGGDVKAAAQGALTGGLMGWAGTVGGAGTAGAESAARYAAHATAGCIGGAVDGSGCGRGAASAVVGKFATNMSENVHPAGRFAIATIAGGTASVITGGKFENGARTAAFGYLFNYCLSSGACTNAFEQFMYDYWPGYKVGTCISNGDCSGKQWAIAGAETALDIAAAGSARGVSTWFKGAVAAEELAVTGASKVLVNAEGKGGIAAAERLFDSLPRVGAVEARETPMGIVRSIELEGGGTASIRPFSQTNPSGATAQINAPGAQHKDQI